MGSASRLNPLQNPEGLLGSARSRGLWSLAPAPTVGCLRGRAEPNALSPVQAVSLACAYRVG